VSCDTAAALSRGSVTCRSGAERAHRNPRDAPPPCRTRRTRTPKKRTVRAILRRHIPPSGHGDLPLPQSSTSLVNVPSPSSPPPSTFLQSLPCPSPSSFPTPSPSPPSPRPDWTGLVFGLDCRNFTSALHSRRVPLPLAFLRVHRRGGEVVRSHCRGFQHTRRLCRGGGGPRGLKTARHPNSLVLTLETLYRAHGCPMCIPWEEARQSDYGGRPRGKVIRSYNR